jgi:hypothetical protein
MIENMDTTKSPEGAVNFGGKMGEFDSIPKMELGRHFNFCQISTTWSPTKKMEIFVFFKCNSTKRKC